MTTETENQVTTGEVVVANESRFNGAHYSEPLTAFTVGWKDPENLESMLDFIAPRVPVGRRFEFKKADNAEAFYSETDDLRAVGSTFKRVEYSGISVNEKTLNNGLTVRVDHDDALTDDWQERTVQLLLQRLLRSELRRALTAVDAASTNASKTWDGSSNPDSDIRSALISGADESGVRPNRLLFGETAWDIRAAAYEVQQTAGAFAGAAVSAADLAAKLFLDGVRVAAARYQVGSTAKSAIVGSAVYAFFAQDSYGKDEPSNLKRFITPVDGGGNFRVYMEESSKFTDITVEHYSNVIATSTLGIQKLTVASS